MAASGLTRRRRRATLPAMSWLRLWSWLWPWLPLASSSPSSPSPSSSTTTSVLGRDRDWWLDRVLLQENFLFDGAHADFAQQFYKLFLDGATEERGDGAAPLDTSQLDSALAADVDAHVRSELAPLAYSQLSPLLQRAVLWDLGIVHAGDVGFTQIRTRCGMRMAEIAVTQAQYEAAGCTAQACSTPTGDLYYQSLQCNGFQMSNASRCLATTGKTPIHASMWSNGGDAWTLPDAFVAKHEWRETPHNYVVYAIHLVGDPNSYGKCVAPSMTVPCVAAEKLTDDQQSEWCKPAASRLVTQWIRAENEIAAASTSAQSTPTLEIGLSIALAVVLLLGVVWWILKRRRERRGFLTDADRPKHLGSHGNDATESEEDGGVMSYFFTDESARGVSKRRGIGLDPHGTAVLGGGDGGGFVTEYDKATSFRVQHPVEAANDLSSKFYEFDLDNVAHSDSSPGCGAVCAGSSAYGDSSGSSSQDRRVSFDKTYRNAPAADKDHANSPTYASNSSTYVSTNGDLAADPYCWSHLRPDGTPSSSFSDSSSRGKPPLAHDSSSPLTLLLHDRLVVAKRVPYVDVSVSRQLSKGAYGEVWVGRMRDKLVAVKRLVAERRKNPKDLDVFIAEIRLMAQFEHRNVMSLIGVAWNSPSNLCMMMEFLEKGDLKNLLKSWSAAELTWRRPGETGSFTERQLQGAGRKSSVAIDVAIGLRYLHNLSPRIVHRDLKSHNILLNQELVAKLCDFGVSRVNEGIDTMTCGVGTAFWTAPEVLVGDKYTDTADVYSFGVVLTELDSHQLPFHDAIDSESGQRMETMHLMHLVCMGEISPSVTALCPASIRKLARDCLQMEPLSRPTLDEIIRRLTEFSRDDSDDCAALTGRARDRASTKSSSSGIPSSRKRTRLSIQHHCNGDDDTATSEDGVLPCTEHLSRTESATSSQRDSSVNSTGCIVVIESPRESDDSENGSVWI